MNPTYTRRTFVKGVAATALSMSLPEMPQRMPAPGKRVGIIGLDTSHSTAFTKVLNAQDAPDDYKSYRVVAAYPYGSKDIESSASRIAGYSEEVKKAGVEIVGSIGDLLKKVDVVLLETNDGRLHLEQATQVLKTGKRLFIDKPMAASLGDVMAIFKTAKKYNVPIFTSSSLRYIKGVEGLDKSQVMGADTFSPATLEKTHPDLFWYGIHGVEALFTVMGRGCQQVTRVHTDSADVVVGTWADGRIGTFRGTRTGKSGYGGTVYGEKGNVALGPYMGYEPLLREIIRYFDSGVVPVTPEETLEIFAFMEAADESKRQGGIPVKLESVMSKVGRL